MKPLVFIALCIALVACSPPKAPVPAGADGNRDAAALYNQSCISCHAAGASGAPRTHDVAAWKPRLDKGMDVLLANTRAGIGAMPPGGMCVDCTDAEIIALIKFMASPAPQ